MNSQRNGGLRHGHPAQLKCIFYKQKLSRQKSSQIFRVAGGQGQGPRGFTAGTRKERRCFAAECGPDPFGHAGTPDCLEQARTKNGAVLLQNVAPTPLGTHEHSRVHCLIRAPRTGRESQEQAHRKKERGGTSTWAPGLIERHFL